MVKDAIPIRSGCPLLEPALQPHLMGLGSLPFVCVWGGGALPHKHQPLGPKGAAHLLQTTKQNETKQAGKKGNQEGATCLQKIKVIFEVGTHPGEDLS